MPEEFLTPREVAKILKVSPEWVYKHAKEYGGVKIGRLVRFSKKIFNKIIEEVIRNGSLQAQGQVDLRLREEREEISPRRIPDPQTSGRGGGESKVDHSKDKYGFRQTLQIKASGTGFEED